jgi:hypothetical protein
MKKLIFILGLMVAFTACTIDEVVNPNSPNVDDFLENPSKTDIDLLVGGLEARARDSREGYIIATGSIARELYFFNSSDPTSTVALLGRGGATLDGSEPQLTGVMSARYKAVKSSDFILEAVDNTTAAISSAQADGYRGVANTFKAYSLLEVITLVNNSGTRVDVRDPENLGPILSRDEVYQFIRDLLDEGFNQLQGAEFAFQLSPGFAGFDTPGEFARFNRAVAARAAIYQENYDDALALVQQSFLDLNGDLSVGPKRMYGNTGFEIPNPVFKSPQQSGDQFIVHNRFINDIQPGDMRINKFRLRNDPVGRDGLNGTHEVALYPNNSAPIDHIRNEELILIYAEANIQAAGGSLQEAERALNTIRKAYGLTDYAGPVDKEGLIDEMLYNRAYSLFAEGHTMLDLRRYARLNDQFLPIDRPGDIIHTEFPLPPEEIQ